MAGNGKEVHTYMKEHSRLGVQPRGQGWHPGVLAVGPCVESTLGHLLVALLLHFC